MRICYRCKVDKPLKEFALDKRAKYGRAYICKICKPLKDKEHRHQRDYNLTPEQLNDLIKSQNNTCKLCPKPLTASNRHIDHNHKTGKVRGLLCAGCNTGLGKFKDDIATLERAILYLKETT